MLPGRCDFSTLKGDSPVTLLRIRPWFSLELLKINISWQYYQCLVINFLSFVLLFYESLFVSATKISYCINSYNYSRVEYISLLRNSSIVYSPPPHPTNMWTWFRMLMLTFYFDSDFQSLKYLLVSDEIKRLSIIFSC